MRSHPGYSRSIPRGLAVTLVALACLPVVASAVGKDKARYIGGTPEDFPLNTPAAIFGNAPKIEGRLDTRAASAFTFDGGQWGTLSIPYEAITYVEYGRKLHRPEFTFAYGAFPLDRLPLRIPDGRHRIWIPWDPFDQYTDKVHYMLTLVYRDQAGHEQSVVFELGKDVVRPALQALERRTAKAVDFTDVSACLLYKTSEECGYGTPAELRGLRTVALDPEVADSNRARILAEIEQANLGLEVVPDPERADMVLSFDSAHSINPDCPCEGGRGEVSIARDARRRVVFVFTGSKRGVWGKNPATGFGKAFADAYRAASASTR